MDNYKAENQEQEIDLVSLFFAVAHRYKQMAAAAVICAVLFGALGSVKEMLNQRHRRGHRQRRGSPPYQRRAAVRRGHGRVP